MQKFLFLGFLLFYSVSLVKAAGPCDTPISISTLLKTKRENHGKTVCAWGWLKIQFEGDQLAQGADRGWLNFFEGPDYTQESVDRDKKRRHQWLEKFQGKCVYVLGRFDKEDTGHFGMWPAGIGHIQGIHMGPKNKCNPMPSVRETTG